jgi:hypothetical protein
MDQNDMDDLPLDPSPLPPEPENDARPLWPWVIGFVVVVAVIAAVIYWRRAPVPPPQKAVEAAAQPATAAPPRALGPSVEGVDLPALDVSDPFVRDLIKRLSSHPEVLAWLATDGLIRNIAVCIENVADGKTPARHLKVLAPKEKFGASGRMERYTTEPRSFARYDGLAAAGGALDMQAVARFYATIKPRLDEAFQELGHAPGDIDAATERAIRHLLEAPVPPADAPLTLAVYSYRYVDDELEGLSGAQKQLLRMGPRHVQTVQAKLRELARALGVPEGRLPT